MCVGAAFGTWDGPSWHRVLAMLPIIDPERAVEPWLLQSTPRSQQLGGALCRACPALMHHCDCLNNSKGIGKVKGIPQIYYIDSSI
jgi:hypothetical protein